MDIVCPNITMYVSTKGVHLPKPTTKLWFFDVNICNKILKNVVSIATFPGHCPHRPASRHSTAWHTLLHVLKKPAIAPFRTTTPHTAQTLSTIKINATMTITKVSYVRLCGMRMMSMLQRWTRTHWNSKLQFWVHFSFSLLIIRRLMAADSYGLYEP